MHMIAYEQPMNLVNGPKSESSQGNQGLIFRRSFVKKVSRLSFFFVFVVSELSRVKSNKYAPTGGSGISHFASLTMLNSVDLVGPEHEPQQLGRLAAHVLSVDTVMLKLQLKHQNAYFIDTNFFLHSFICSISTVSCIFFAIKSNILLLEILYDIDRISPVKT